MKVYKNFDEIRGKVYRESTIKFKKKIDQFLILLEFWKELPFSIKFRVNFGTLQDF